MGISKKIERAFLFISKIPSFFDEIDLGFISFYFKNITGDGRIIHIIAFLLLCTMLLLNTCTIRRCTFILLIYRAVYLTLVYIILPGGIKIVIFMASAWVKREFRLEIL